MTLYQLVMRDGGNRVLKRTTIEACTDQEAIEVAQLGAGDFTCIEVWQGDRAVCLIGNPGDARQK